MCRTRVCVVYFPGFIRPSHSCERENLQNILREFLRMWFKCSPLISRINWFDLWSGGGGGVKGHGGPTQHVSLTSVMWYIKSAFRGISSTILVLFYWIILESLCEKKKTCIIQTMFYDGVTFYACQHYYRLFFCIVLNKHSSKTSQLLHLRPEGF